MDFRLSENQEALVDEVRRFALEYFDADSVSQWQRDMGLPDEVARAFVNLDFKGFSIVDHVASDCYNAFAQVLVLEEISRVAGSVLPFHHDFFQLRVLEKFASTSQIQEIRRQYCNSGKLTSALAVSEPQAGSDTQRMQTAVKTVNGILRLNGTKMFVHNGEYASSLLVVARDDDKPCSPDGRPALSVWMVPSHTKGIRAVPENNIAQQMLPYASIKFDNVILDESYRIYTDVDKGFQELFKTFEYGRLYACAVALGEAQAAMEDAVAWAQHRRAFGAPLAQFQQIQQMLTDMEVKLRCMRSMVYQAAWEFDHDMHDRLSVALMKRFVPRTATEVASDAMQILGGKGFTANERVSSIWQDCRSFQIAEGTDQIMVYVSAPLILEKYSRCQ